MAKKSTRPAGTPSRAKLAPPGGWHPVKSTPMDVVIRLRQHCLRDVSRATGISESTLRCIARDQQGSLHTLQPLASYFRRLDHRLQKTKIDYSQPLQAVVIQGRPVRQVAREFAMAERTLRHVIHRAAKEVLPNNVSGADRALAEWKCRPARNRPQTEA